MDIAVLAQVLSSRATFVVAAGILYQGREARDDEDRQGERYETAWTINPLLLEGSGYSDYKGYEDEVQALEDQARALEKISRDLEEAKEAMYHRREEQVS